MADTSGIAWIGDEPEFYRELVSILLEISRIPSPSGAEQKMTAHCSTFLYHCGFSVEQDEFGNIMATRGETPSGKYVLPQRPHGYAHSRVCCEMLPETQERLRSGTRRTHG